MKNKESMIEEIHTVLNNLIATGFEELAVENSNAANHFAQLLQEHKITFRIAIEYAPLKLQTYIIHNDGDEKNPVEFFTLSTDMDKH